MAGPSGTNIILYIQLSGYCIAAILSLCISIPMSMHQENFQGHLVWALSVCLAQVVPVPSAGEYKGEHG